MKRRLLLFLLLAVVGVAVAAVVKYRACLFHTGQDSELFERYAQVPGVQADFIKDFRLNDTTTVDVTIFEAADSAGWATIGEMLGIPVLPPDVVDIIMQGKPSSLFFLSPKDNQLEQPDTVLCNNNLIVYSFQLQKACVYDLVSDEQYNAIISYKVNQLNKKQ